MPTTSPRSSRKRLGRTTIGVIAAVAAASLALLTPGAANASISSAFELDGNVLDDAATAPDWGASSGTNSIFTVSGGLGVERSPLPTGFFDAGFARDFTPGSTADSTTFTNGAKDTGNISGGSNSWSCVKANNVTNKGDIQNAYTAVYVDTTFTPAHLVLYFGMEKNTPNGDNNMGVWLLQDENVGCNPGSGAGTAFTGVHKDGDVLLVAAFTNGGGNPQVSAYQWQGSSPGALNPNAIASGTTCGASASICAVTNAAAVTTPWQTVNGPTQGTTLGTDQFYEGAIDLTANNLDHTASGPICVNKFVFDTRSSQTIGASIYDYAEGSVQTCGSSSIVTNLYQKVPPAADKSLAPPDNTVTLPASVYDTATITPGVGTTAGGTVTYALYTDNTCTTASTSPAFSPASSATVTIAANGTVPPSPTLTFSTAGTYYWQAIYTPPAGSRDSGSTSTCTSEPLTVVKPQPTIATTASASVQVGGNPASTINDVATISNGYFPSGGPSLGTVTFKLFGPFDPSATIGASSCTAANQLTSSTNGASRVNDTTATATSDSYTPTSAGRYQWTASYSGNTQNLAVAETACGVSAEQVLVTPATPSLATKMALSDRVVVSGVPNAGSPAGTVKFQLYPSADCSGSAVYDSGDVALTSGTASTPAATEVTAGTYSWKVSFTPSASNVNYTSGSTTCTAAQSDEKATISYAGTSPAS